MWTVLDDQKAVLNVKSQYDYYSEVLECDISSINLQNHAISPPLDAYVLKMCLDVQNGLLVVENGPQGFMDLFTFFFMKCSVALPVRTNLESGLMSRPPRNVSTTLCH